MALEKVRERLADVFANTKTTFNTAVDSSVFEAALEAPKMFGKSNRKLLGR